MYARWMPGPQHLDPMVVAAVRMSVERELARRGQSVAAPASPELSALYAYWREAAAIAGEDIALLVAGELPVGALGLTSYSLISQPTLADALAALGDTMLGRLVPGMTLRVVPLPNCVEVRIRSDGDAAMMSLLEEIVLAVIHRHLALLTTPATVQAVSLRRPAPGSAAPWRMFFGIAPRFAQRSTVLRLGAHDLELGLRTASPELQTIVQAAHALGAADATIASRVRTYLRAHIRDEVDATKIAAALAMPARTLQRKLQVEQTSLRELSTRVRIEIATEMLADDDATIAEIGDRVGYAQPASFTRAFVAATGETPQDYRKRTRDE